MTMCIWLIASNVMVTIQWDYSFPCSKNKYILSILQYLFTTHLGPKIHRWACGRWLSMANVLWINVDQDYFAEEEGGFRYHCRENQGDQLMLSSVNPTCGPNYSLAQTKAACFLAWSKQTFKNAFTQVVSSFVWAEEASQRDGLRAALRLRTVGSKVNSDFLFTRKDLRALWFPVVSWSVCALVSGVVCTELQVGCYCLISLWEIRENKNRTSSSCSRLPMSWVLDMSMLVPPKRGQCAKEGMQGIPRGGLQQSGLTDPPRGSLCYIRSAFLAFDLLSLWAQTQRTSKNKGLC